MRDSNPHRRFWRPVLYHWTNPLYEMIYTFKTTYIKRNLPTAVQWSFGYFRSEAVIHKCSAFTHVLCFANGFRSSFASVNACIPAAPDFRNPLSPLLGQALDRLVAVSSIHCCTSTSALSTSSSSRGLTSFQNGISHLEGGFTLRCLQRLSLPNLATRPCSWQNNRYTSGPSTPVLSY